MQFRPSSGDMTREDRLNCAQNFAEIFEKLILQDETVENLAKDQRKKYLCAVNKNKIYEVKKVPAFKFRQPFCQKNKFDDPLQPNGILRFTTNQ